MAERKRPPDANDPNHTPTASPSSPGLDDCFRALSHPERRRLLRHLNYQETPRTVEGLAVELADHETANDTSATREQLAVQLRHKHPPLLVETNLAERTSRDSIRATDATSDAIRVLEATTDVLY